MNKTTVIRKGYKRRYRRKDKRRGFPLNEKQKNQVYKMVNKDVEKKNFDTVTTVAQQYGATGLSANLTNISQSVTGEGRIGQQIVAHSLNYRMSFENQATNPNSTTRVVFFQWRASNTAAAPTLADIFDLGPGAVVNVWSPYNYDKRHLFTILKDWMFDMNGNVGSSKYTRVFTGQIYLVRKTAKTNYDFGANTGDHHIYLFIIGSNAAGANGQLVTSDTRLFYTDA